MSIRKAFLLAVPILSLALGAAAWKLKPFAKRPQPSRPPSSVEERVGLLRCLSELCRSPAVTHAVPTLERWIQEDPDADVRQKAVEVRGLIAYEHENKVCPLSVARALLDREANVRGAAGNVAGLCKEFPPAVVPALLEATAHEDASVRSDAILALGKVASRNETARAAIEAARDDKDFGVRHNAHCQWFQLTGDLDNFVPYCLRIQAEYSNLPLLPPDGSEGAKAERCMKQLMQRGTLHGLARQAEERPDKVAKLTLHYLGGGTPVMRRGAATFVGSLAEDALTARREAGDLAEGPAPGGGKQDDRGLPNVLGPLDSPRLLARLAELKVEEALLRLVRTDDDAEVRETATAAVKKWAALQKGRP